MLFYFLSVKTRNFLLSFFLFSSFGLWCDILPKDNAILNYTRVYFEEERIALAHEYLLSVDSDSSAVIANNPEKTLAGAFPAFHINDLKWNRHYFWKIVARDKHHRILHTGKLHHFTILRQPTAYADEILIDVKTNKKDKHADGLIFIDYTRSIYNRSGDAVWTMPFIENFVDDRTQIRDLKLTQNNTITFLTDKLPLEIDYNGSILWKAPFPFLLNGDTIVYHHDFKKTHRGTYMVLGNKKTRRRVTVDLINTAKPDPETEMIDSIPYKKTWMTVLLEFNDKGDLIWFWDANTYITDFDLNERKNQSGFPEFSTHSNAFSENTQGDKVYVGFRDLSRIVKIDKKTKRVEMVYGATTQTAAETARAGNLFKHQHDATITDRNTLLIFNNNNPGIHALKDPYTSSVIELKENTAENNPELVWHFDINFDELTDGKAMTGGNVIELPNTNLLVCAGTLNRVFEVTRNKEIVWDAFVMMKPKNTPRFRPFPQYRCNWTAQLKEFHFIPYLNSPIKNKGSELKINLEITNTGNADDYYVITIFSGDTKIVYTKETKLTTPSNSFQLKCKLPVSQSKESMRIEVRSKNSYSTKTLSLIDSKN